MEIWKKIGYNQYEISNLGNVRNGSKILKHYLSVGYYKVDLYDNWKRKKCFVHRLIAEAFIPKIEGKTHVNHINGVRTDNAILNLEWCTNAENQRHAYKFLGRKGNGFGKRGKLNKLSKPIEQYNTDGIFIKRFDAVSDAMRELQKESCAGIIKALKNEYSHAYGFKWMYAS